MCEVENRLVINDLLNKSTFSNHDYTIIHKDSPDKRGIDCALLFSDKFQLLEHDFLEIMDPSSDRSTRDIVYAKLKYKDNVVNVFVNHWPSRWGGEHKTNDKRVFATTQAQEVLASNKANDKISKNQFKDTDLEIEIITNEIGNEVVLKNVVFDSNSF